MGKGPSKFYEEKSNHNYCAVFLGQQGLDVLYGDEDARSAVTASVKDLWSSYLDKQHADYRLSLIGKIKHSTFEVRMMIQQGIVKEVMKQMSLKGWQVIGFMNVQEGTLYGHTWLFEKGEANQSYDESISVSPASTSEMYISGTQENFTDEIEEIIRSISTVKGVKELEKIEEHNGIKVLLRHKPWSLDEFDWWGGTYLLAHLFEKLAKFELPIIFQGCVGLPSKERNPRFCFVAPCGTSGLKLRRVHHSITKDLISYFESDWPDGIEYARPEDLGYRLQLSGSPWATSLSPTFVLELFKIMQNNGHRYWGSFRIESDKHGRTAMAFVTDKTDKNNQFCCIHLRNSNELSFYGVKDEIKQSIRPVIEHNWYKGVEAENTSSITCGGFPWTEELFGDMLILGVIETMKNHEWHLLTAVNVGYGGDILIFSEADPRS